MNACILAAMSRRSEPALYKLWRGLIRADIDAARQMYFGFVGCWHEAAMGKWLRIALAVELDASQR